MDQPWLIRLKLARTDFGPILAVLGCTCLSYSTLNSALVLCSRQTGSRERSKRSTKRWTRLMKSILPLNKKNTSSEKKMSLLLRCSTAPFPENILWFIYWLGYPEDYVCHCTNNIYKIKATQNICLLVCMLFPDCFSPLLHHSVHLQMSCLLLFV